MLERADYDDCASCPRQPACLRAYQAYAAYRENDMCVRSWIGSLYEGGTEIVECYPVLSSVIQLCGISEHRHLPTIGYFDIPSNFVKTQDQPPHHQFLSRSADIVHAQCLP